MAETYLIHPLKNTLQFTNQQIIDTYTAFINNWKNARQAIKIATQAKPAFERFLEVCTVPPIQWPSLVSNKNVVPNQTSIPY